MQKGQTSLQQYSPICMQISPMAQVALLHTEMNSGFRLVPRMGMNSAGGEKLRGAEPGETSQEELPEVLSWPHKKYEYIPVWSQSSQGTSPSLEARGWGHRLKSR